MSILAPGTIITDIEVYKQRCYIVLNTPLGSDPFRPLFGCNYSKYIDTNIITAAANIKKEIIDAITLWVPEVKLSKITTSTAAGKLSFTIQITFNGESISFPFTPGKSAYFSATKGTFILIKDLPFGSTVATITLKVDGAPVSFPGSPPWASHDEMLTWLKENKADYGTWGMSDDVLILYLDKKYNNAEMALALAA